MKSFLIDTVIVIIVSIFWVAFFAAHEANLRQEIKVMERSLQSSFDETYLVKCELADRNRVPKWVPAKYKSRKEK